MDFNEIDQIMANHNLGRDPAFNYTDIAIQDIPCEEGGCPLGLYYPDQNLIVVPHNAAEGTLLHELGHRYGHYYINNISEAYAEGFRNNHQPHAQLVYPNGGNNNSRLHLALQNAVKLESRVACDCGIKVARMPVYDLSNITGGITDAWIEYPTGTRVTKVPVGQNFSLYVKRWAHNPGGGLWSVCVTAISSDGTMHDYDVTNASWTNDLGYQSSPDQTRLLNMGPMPNRPVVITVKLFTYPYSNYAMTPPDMSLWYETGGGE